MSEPFLERLSRFTPDAGGLDRDALLFAAGRSSARPNRGWMAAASLLAGTQALSLVLLWPHPTPQDTRFAVPVAVAPEPPTTPEIRTTGEWANPGRSSARRSLLKLEIEDGPADVTFIDSAPPLRVFGSLPPSVVD